MVECGHLGPQKNKHNMPHQLIPLTQVIPMQAFLNNCWEIMQLAPVTSKTGNLVLFIPKVLQAVVMTWIFLRHTVDVRSDSRCPLHVMDAAFCIVGHLTPNLAECSDVFLFLLWLKYSLIYCRHPTLHSGHSVFSLSDNLHPIRLSVPMFSFHNISPFLFPDLFS